MGFKLGNSLHAKNLIMTVSLIAVTVLVLTAWSAFRSSELLEKNYENQINQSLKQSSKVIKNFVEVQETNVHIWLSNPIITQLILNEAMSAIFLPATREYFQTFKSKNPWIFNIMVVSHDSVIYSDVDELQIKSTQDNGGDGFAKMKTIPTEGSIGINSSEIFNGGNLNTLVIKRAIRHEKLQSDMHMVVFFDLNVIYRYVFEDVKIGGHGFMALLAESKEGKGLVITSDERESSERNEFGDILKGASNFDSIAGTYSKITVTREKIPESSLSVVAVASTKDIRDPVFQLIVRSVFLGMITALVGIMTTYFYSRKITFPLVMLTDKVKQISQGDLSVQTGIRSNDEIGVLAVAFDEMAQSLKRSMEEIKEYSSSLEQKVEERTAALKQKSDDINAILQNMNQGIFTIGRCNIINPEYSHYLVTILETENIAGQNVCDVLLSRTDLSTDVYDQIKSALSSIIGEDILGFELNSWILPKQFEKKVKSGTKILDVQWNAILNSREVVEKIIVTVRDVTELRRLQITHEAQKRELEIIGEIISISRKQFAQFIKSAQGFIKENRSLILNSQYKDPNVIAQLFRNMHTIKGNARTFGFKILCDAVHQAEQTYDGLRLREKEQWNSQQLITELKLVEELIERYNEINEAKLGRVSSSNDGVILDRKLFNRACDMLSGCSFDKSSDVKNAFNSVKDLFCTADTITIEELASGMLRAVPSLARDLEKAVPQVNLQ
ncbi:MAG: Hpt domain-containing protein, partial [Oligoflexales bacterium]|nr:Hpt domain-containing protein [Oligoflexales bacterium]